MANSHDSTEPVAWAMPKGDGTFIDVITPAEHAREEGSYTVPLFAHPVAQQPQAEPKCECNATMDTFCEVCTEYRKWKQPHADEAKAAGLEASINILSQLVDEQRQLLVEVDAVFGVDEHGIVFEDSDSALIDRVRSHLAATNEAQQPQAEAAIDKCSECGKASTKDSMWALYCVECIETKIAPALAADQPPAATVQQRAEGGVEAHLHQYLPIGTKLFAAPQQADAGPAWTTERITAVAQPIAMAIAENCQTAPQLVFPHLFLGLKELLTGRAEEMPHGFALVPVEPTVAMLQALSGEWHPSRHRPDLYRAMLAAQGAKT